MFIYFAHGFWRDRRPMKTSYEKKSQEIRVSPLVPCRMFLRLIITSRVTPEFLDAILGTRRSFSLCVDFLVCHLNENCASLCAGLDSNVSRVY